MQRYNFFWEQNQICELFINIFLTQYISGWLSLLYINSERLKKGLFFGHREKLLFEGGKGIGDRIVMG
mgnify:CR=1 FL=1